MRGWIIAFGATALLACGGVALLGLPGAALLELSVGVLLGGDALARIPADTVWPAAIYITLLWPPSILLGYALGFRLLRRRSWPVRAGVLLLTVAAWGVLLSLLFYRLAVAPGQA